MTRGRRITRLSIGEALQAAVELHRKGQLAAAEELYRKVLDTVPEHPDALHFLGVLNHQAGKSEEAVALIRRAIESMPAYTGAHNNLGNVLKEMGHFEEAEAAYRETIALDPEQADPHNNLGVLCKNRGNLDDAVAQYEVAIRKDPRHADAHHNLASALTSQGKLRQAEKFARRAIALQPDHSHAYRNLSDTLRRAGRKDEAVKVLRQWLSHHPENPVARHLLAANLGEGVPDRAADEYVIQVFDEFSGSFDAVLKGLDYRAPQQVAEAIAAALRAPRGDLKVLDAGCGTGLSGMFLRQYARLLIGVDLSPGMISMARRRGIYDRLVTMELTRFLRDHEQELDLIASVDTLIYIGDLGPFLAASCDRLRPDGLLVFSVEHAVDLTDEAGFRLEPSGRYSHSRAYLQRVLANAGLMAGSMREVVLRKEMGKPVGGLVVTARFPRPGSKTVDR